MTRNEGPSPGLAELLLRELPGMLPFVRMQLGPELRCKESAADILQSVFGDLLSEDVPFDYRDDERLRSWLRTIVVNKIRQRLRMLRAKKRGGAHCIAQLPAEVDVPSNEDAPCDRAILDEELERLEQALAAMPPHYRSAIVLTRLLGYSHEEAARHLGRTQDSLRNVLFRALALLTRLMDRKPA